MSQLEKLRDETERLSLELLQLLNRRAECTLAIAREKQRLGLPIRDPWREAKLLDHIAEANQGPLDEPSVRALFRATIDACVALMEDRRWKGLRVGGPGPRVVINVRGHVIGGPDPVYIAGPCSVESEEQVNEAARRLAAMGVGFFRGGAFKPRTSPYAFQGLGEQGLKLLRDAGHRYGLATITEATSPENAPIVAEYADIIQIGARNMYNYDLLRAVGKTGKPILLKRGLSASLDEWLHAAEYISLAGCDKIILCERGIRGFGRETRATLDLSIVPLALAASRLPVVVDVSHAAGRRDILAPLARAAFGIGAHGVMIEVHPDPDVALSDAEQQLSLDDFAALQRTVREELNRTASALAAQSSNPAHAADSREVAR